MTDTTEANTQLLCHLEGRLRYWQEVLKLRDWDVNIQITALGDMSPEHPTGSIMVYEKAREALIQFVPKEQRGKQAFEVSEDYLLVHELCHIYFDSFRTLKDSFQDQAEEVAVDAFAKIIVGLEAKFRGSLKKALLGKEHDE